MKVKKVIHLQIKQGKLLEKGKVNNDTTWKSVDAYSPNDFDFQAGKDFFKLSWNQKAIDLDELTAPAGHVITGNLHLEI